MTKPNPSVSGLHIYQDKQRRTVYYDTISKKAYILRPSKMGQYNFYSKRFLFPIIFFIFCYSIKFGEFQFGFAGSLLVSAIVFLILEAFFRLRFLASLSISDHFVPYKKETILERLKSNSSKTDLLMRSFLYSAFGILLIIYGFMAEFNTTEMILCSASSVCLIGYGLLQLIASRE